MPNHVSHRLKITGKSNELKRFRKECFRLEDNRELLDFQKIIPRPEKVDWYAWNKQNWGTKWNAYSGWLKEISKEEIDIYFDTAWSVPEPVIEKMAELYPELDFSGCAYDEGGGFGAHIDYTQGEGAVYYVDCDDTLHQFVYGCSRWEEAS